MKVTVVYQAQLRTIAQRQRELVELRDAVTLENFIKQVAARLGPNGSRHLLSAEGQVAASLLVTVNQRATSRHQDATLQLADGDEVQLIPPIAGG